MALQITAAMLAVAAIREWQRRAKQASGRKRSGTKQERQPPALPPPPDL